VFSHIECVLSHRMCSLIDMFYASFKHVYSDIECVLSHRMCSLVNVCKTDLCALDQAYRSGYRVCGVLLRSVYISEYILYKRTQSK
jgi:hypothetical protein